MPVVYKAMFPNGKVYIGKSKNFENRKMSHFYNSTYENYNSTKMKNAINKYGFDNIIWDILFESDDIDIINDSDIITFYSSIAHYFDISNVIIYATYANCSSLVNSEIKTKPISIINNSDNQKKQRSVEGNIPQNLISNDTMYGSYCVDIYEYLVFNNISGAIYKGLPHIVSIILRLSFNILAKPKSAILIISLFNRIFAGLISRCTILRFCK